MPLVATVRIETMAKADTHHFLLTRLIDTPLMIQPAKLEYILSALAPRLGMEYKPELRMEFDGEDPAERPPFEIRDGVAIFNVFGSLVHRGGFMSSLSGLTSFTQLSSDFNRALKSSEVHSILMVVDSPGGEVSGAFDFADQVFQARGEKPIIALVEDLAASAGFLIASAADEVVNTQTGIVGSVGIITVHVDRTEQNAMNGLKVSHIFRGDRKTDGSPDLPLSEEARTAIQNRIDTTFRHFVNVVARNRSMSPEAVVDTQAGLFIGEEGVEIGFADRVGSMQDVLNDLSERRQAGLTSGFALTAGVKTMNEFLKGLDEKTLALIPEAKRTEIDSPQALANFLAERALASDAQADKLRDELNEVKDREQSARFEKLAAEFTNISVERETLATVLQAVNDSCSEEVYGQLVGMLKALDGQARTVDLFETKGNDASPDSLSSYDQLKSLAKLHQEENPGSTWEKSFAAVMRNRKNRALVKGYRVETKAELTN